MAETDLFFIYLTFISTALTTHTVSFAPVTDHLFWMVLQCGTENMKRTLFLMLKKWQLLVAPALIITLIVQTGDPLDRDQLDGPAAPIPARLVPARRQRYLAGTPRPAIPAQLPADQLANVPAQPVNGPARRRRNIASPPRPAIPAELPAAQPADIPVEHAAPPDENDALGGPTGRGHRTRRPPASLDPSGDYLVPPSRRLRLD